MMKLTNKPILLFLLFVGLAPTTGLRARVQQVPTGRIAREVIKDITGKDIGAVLSDPQTSPLRFLHILYTILESRTVHEKVHPHTYAWLHQEMEAMCKKLNLEKPELRFHRNGGYNNAYASSFWRRMGVVVIGKGLMRQTLRQELLAVLGHELGHVACSHVIKKVTLAIASLIAVRQAQHYAFEKIDVSDSIYKRYALNAAFGVALALFGAKVSRYFEKQADMVCARQLGRGKELAQFFARQTTADERGKRETDKLIKQFWDCDNRGILLYLPALFGRSVTQACVGAVRLSKRLLSTHPSHAQRVKYLLEEASS